MSLLTNNKDHVIKLIQWIIDEVNSSGGDGDAIWYTKYYDIKELFNLFNEINNLIEFKWTIVMDNDHSFSAQIDQAYILVTSKKEDFDNRPSWQQVSIAY